MQQVMAAIPGRGVVGVAPSRISKGIVSLSRNYAAAHRIGALHQQLAFCKLGSTFTAHHVGVMHQQHSSVKVDKTQRLSTWLKFTGRRIQWKGLTAAAFGIQIFCLQGSSEDSARSYKDGGFDEKKDLKQAKERVGEGKDSAHVDAVEAVGNKPESCTADELHFVAVPGTEWRLALWRYRPPAGVPLRNHPVLMLSGIGTNAIGFDLAPSVSLARFISSAGFDTWILEVRGAGLGTKEGPAPVKDVKPENGATQQAGNAELDFLVSASKIEKNGASEKPVASENLAALEKAPANGGNGEIVSKLSDTIWGVLERLKGLVNQGQSTFLSAKFLDQISSVFSDELITGRISEFRKRLSEVVEEAQNSEIANRLADRRNRLAKLLEEAQLPFSPRMSDLQERMSAIVDEYQKILDLIGNFDWDFDHYLEEDVPAAIDYVLQVSKSADGKVVGIGHSMGGILLYATLATHGEESRVAAVVTIASALDYGVSDSTLKLLLPLADPSRLLNVPVVPLGALMAAIHPLVTRPPYALAWIGHQVSADEKMDPELFSKLVLNNFGTIPVKLLLHLATAFKPGGLKNRDGSVFYKELIRNNKIPVLALAGDEDKICPPPAVLDTVKAMPSDIVKYKEYQGYAHYDLLVSRQARDEVYPAILKFLLENDAAVDGDHQPRLEDETADYINGRVETVAASS